MPFVPVPIAGTASPDQQAGAVAVRHAPPVAPLGQPRAPVADEALLVGLGHTDEVIPQLAGAVNAAALAVRSV